MCLGRIEVEEISIAGEVLALGRGRQEEGGCRCCARTSVAGLPGLANPAAFGASTVIATGRAAQKAHRPPSPPLPRSAGDLDRTEENFCARHRRKAWTA